MKKTLSLGFGLMLLGSALLLGVDASRDKYHTYLYQNARTLSLRRVSTAPVRPFSDRIGRQSHPLRVERGGDGRGRNMTKNLRYPVHNKRSFYTTVEGSLQPLRGSTNRTYPAWQQSLNRRGTLSFQKIEDAVEVFETYENETFSVQVPEGWLPSLSDQHLFKSRKSDFTISIERTEEPCSNVSFTACAIALSTTLNHTNAAEKILTLTSIERNTHFSDTVLGERVQTKTMTESFVGQIEDKEMFISRYFVADLDGTVYIIETRTGTRNAPRYIGVTKNIFDSFRLFAETEEETVE